MRIGRYSETGGIYLITTVVEDRIPIFNNLYLGRILVRTLKAEQENAKTLAYVIMPDHLHWLMQLHAPCSISRVVADVKSVSAHQINRKQNRRGKFWQSGFHDHAIRREEDIRHLSRYVVANPLRGGLVTNIGDYSLWDAIWF